MKSVIKLIIMLLTISAVSAQSFKITHPNGGEKFAVGTDKTITWEGCEPEDEVTLEYSVDGGKGWSTITSNATGLSYKWDDIPEPASDECLMKVEQKANDGLWKTLSGHTEQVLSVSWSPDGTRIASSSGDGTSKIWDASSGTELLTLLEHTKQVISVSWSPDGTKIASSWDRTIKIWNASGGTELRTLSGHTEQVYGVSWSPDGTRIASASRDRTIKIWNASSGTELRTLSGHTSSVWSVSWSPDGTRISSGSQDHSIKIWDASSGTELHTLSGHTESVLSVPWSPDGTRIASGSWDRTIKIWDAAAGTELSTISGLFALVSSVSWSPDGTRIASASWNGTIKIWDAASGTELSTLSGQGHSGPVWSVSWSPDGTRIASGSVDNTIKIWIVVSFAQEDVSDSTWSITKTDDISEDIPKNNSSTYPNPFSESITIEYTLEKAANVTINIYNSNAELVSAIDEGLKIAGKHSALFDAADLPSGAYYYSVNSGDNVESGKMQLIR